MAYYYVCSCQDTARFVEMDARRPIVAPERASERACRTAKRPDTRYAVSMADAILSCQPADSISLTRNATICRINSTGIGLFRGNWIVPLPSVYDANASPKCATIRPVAG